MLCLNCGLPRRLSCPTLTRSPTLPQTWRNWDLSRMTMHELYTQFGLDVQTIDFVGHAVALHANDGYMMQARMAACFAAVAIILATIRTPELTARKQ